MVSTVIQTFLFCHRDMTNPIGEEHSPSLGLFMLHDRRDSDTRGIHSLPVVPRALHNGEQSSPEIYDLDCLTIYPNTTILIITSVSILTIDKRQQSCPEIKDLDELHQSLELRLDRYEYIRGSDQVLSPSYLH